MSEVVLDTVIVAALLDGRDKWHVQSVAIRDVLKAIGTELVLLDPVINETVSVLVRRVQEQGRSSQAPELLQALERLAPSEKITWVSSETRRLYPQILSLVQEHQGELNFHDALIALACRERGIQYIASFDRDFDRIPWLTRLDSPDSILQIQTDLNPDSLSDISGNGG
jgi:predicted nucleic acid-binding protein